MVGTKKRWMTALLVLVLAVCLSALCWFVLPTKNINAADGSGAETTTEQPAAGESQSAEALQQAIDAAADGATVQMTSNITGNISIAEGKNIVLDLNGFTLTGEGNHTIVNNGTLTITDGSAAKSGAVDNVTHGKGALVNNGTATLDGGTFKRSAEAGVSATDNGGNSWYVIDNHGTLTINNGVAVYHGTSAETAAQWKYSSLIRNIGTGADATATLTVNGGEFYTGLIALKNDDFGMLDVNGGQISSGNQAVQNWYKATVDGGTFDGMVITWFYSDNTGAADMTISDGTFSGQVKSVDFEAGFDGAYPLVSDGTTISGGTFDVLPLKVEYLAADVALDVVDGAYSVVQGQAAANAVIDGSTYPFVDENDIIEQGTFVAQIGNTFFETLADAVWSTGTGGVEATEITIIGQDAVVDGAGVVIEGQNVIIDLNGKTYNVINPTVGSPGTETNGFQMLKGSKVVFRNGSIASGVAKILLQNYCDLTLEDVTINATGSTSIQYIASNNNGSFTAVGNTQLIAGAGQVAFDVYYGMSANYDDGVTVTFGEDFTGKVVGKVEYSAASRVADGTWQDKAVVTIENGEFDIAINLVDNESATDANINISGGNFTQAFDGAYLASDAVLYPTADGAFAVADQATAEQETIGVAQIGQVIYKTLADALAAAREGDTVKLLDNVNESIVIAAGQDITIDLGGYTLTGEGDHGIINNGTLVITDSVGGGKVVVTADNKAALLNYGDATLLGGEFTRETAGTGGWYVIKNYGSLVIGEENKECGVVVDSNGGDESSLLVSGYYDANDEAANKGLITSANPLKVVINGGTFNGGLNTIKNDSESVMTINGGTFTNGKNYTVQNCNEMTVNGGTFVQTASKNVYGSKAVYALYSDDNTKLTITAGDFTAVTYAVYLVSNVNAVISGGTFEGETALFAGKKVTLNISGGAFTGTEKYGISIGANAVVDISGEETVISGGEYGLRVSSAFGNINISDATISGETAVYMNRPTSYAITSGVFNGAINVTNNTAGISGGKFAVMPNEAYFIEGLTGALVDGYYVPVKATSPVEELRPAIFEAQAAVRSYAAALGINWADIASARAADAQAVLAAYDAIESAASVDLVLVAQLNAMDALDEYAAALAAELDAYKAEKIAALETLAGDGYVPAYAIAAINGAASVAEVDACYNAAVAEINAADDGEITPPTPSDNGDGISLTGVYVMLGVILVVAVAALMILLLKKQKQAEAAEAKAAAPLDRELAEVKQAVEADETAAAVSAAAEDDDKEQIVIEANVRTFDEAYGELDEEQKKLFNDVKDYALTKEGAALTELSSGVCVKKGSKQIVKLTVRRGNPVALFVIENEMIKDFRRNSDAPVKLKVKATELVLRSGGDLEAAKAMVDVAVDQIEKDILAAKERRREARRLRRQRKREQKRQ